MSSKLEQDVGNWLRVQQASTAAMESVAVAGMRSSGAPPGQAKAGNRGLKVGAAVLREVGGLAGAHTKTPLASALGPVVTFAVWAGSADSETPSTHPPVRLRA
jgi:hypothetical protein